MLHDVAGIFSVSIEHYVITPGLLWDRFGITSGLLPAYKF
jgi:hypothetical protein